MGVTMTEEEAWAFVESSHTGMLTTLGADGWPVTLPTWFVVLDGALYVRTPEKTAKVRRMRRDDRASFLVEGGEHWRELRAVCVPVRATIVHDADVADRVDAALDAKYKHFRTAPAAMPSASRRHYARPAIVRLAPAGRWLTWDNRKLQLPDERRVATS